MADAEPPTGTAEVTAADTTAAEDRVARARSRRSQAADADDIAPKLPRGGGFKLGKGHLVKIALTASLLVMLIVVQRPCADAVSSFVTGFDGQGSDKANAKMPKPGTVDGSGAATPRYETLKNTLTEAEWKAMVERQRSGAGGAGGAGSSSQGSAGSAGSASGSSQ